MSGLTDIRKGNDNTKRIVINVKIKCPDSQDYCTSAYSIVNEIFADWKNDDRVLFLAIEVWGGPHLHRH